MPQYGIQFHVEESSSAGAEEWLRRAKEILQANRDLLVSPTGDGVWCPGHVLAPEQLQPLEGSQTSLPEPPAVLKMGPRN